MSKRLPMWGVILMLCALAGCTRPLEFGQVEGTVTVNGRPLRNVTVQFMPNEDKGGQGPTALAVTDEKGHYVLKYEDRAWKVAGEGAVVGWHKVTVEDLSRAGLPQGVEPPPARVSQKYATAGTTPLEFEVKPGMQTIDLPLEP